METWLRGMTRKVVIADGRPAVIIGERINPTGKKKLAAALLAGDLEIVRSEALAQVNAGAHVLDVNVGAAGVDEPKLLPQAVKLVLETVDVPISIDSANGDALRAALNAHSELNPGGRPLVNSVNGEEASLRRVLPLVAEYGAAVIGLCLDDEGIPATPEGRLAVARRIVERAEATGVSRDSVLIDCLALTVGADCTAGRTTLETIRLVKQELGVNLALGASNVSFGLPDRETITGTFLAMAIQAGVNCPIVDAAKVGPYILAADLLMGCDEYAMGYIKAFRKRSQQSAG